MAIKLVKNSPKLATEALQALQMQAEATKKVQETQKALKQAQSLSQELREKVDRLATLKTQLDAIAPLQKEAEELKKLLQSVANGPEYDKTQKVVLQGDIGKVEFSPMTEQRVIKNMQDLIGTLKEKLGYDGLIALIKITLGDVDKYLTEAEAAPFLDKKDGARTLKAVSIKE